MPALILDHVEAGHASTTVLKDVSLRVEPGTVVALTGENGAGKSTLLDVALGSLTARRGTVHRASRVALIPQKLALNPHLPIVVADLVRLALPRKMRRTTVRQAVTTSLERVGIASLAQAPLGEISGGQQRRAFLAHALARKADLLLLDEPDAGVDESGLRLLWSVARAEAERGAAVVLITHHQEAAEHADRFLALKDGALTALDP